MVLRIQFIPFAFALALSPAAAGESAATATPPPEELISAKETPAGIDVTVPTGGCTKKADFQVSSSPIENGEAAIEFYRLRRDTCKGNFPDGLKLQFSWAELKLPEGTKLSVRNPVEPPPGAQSTKTPEVKKLKRKMRHWHRHRHRRLHGRHAVHARLHAGASKRASLNRMHFCREYPHSRRCQHLRRTRSHRRHHRAYCN